ncbi:MAG TPA: hypothetical protein VF363_10745, partial [Candidatus Eisenbacteria bacterium]
HAPDVNRNLALAEARVAESTGAGTAPPPPSPIALSPAESWWLAALLVAGAAALGAAVALRPGRAGRSRAARIAALALAVAGVLLGGWRVTRAVEDRTHPEAVVIAPSLEARRGPDEPTRPPVELRAGERVRLGRARGGDVEVRLGGSAIGWASREGLWRVSDAARYTAAFRPR